MYFTSKFWHLPLKNMIIEIFVRNKPEMKLKSTADWVFDDCNVFSDLLKLLHDQNQLEQFTWILTTEQWLGW